MRGSGASIGLSEWFLAGLRFPAIANGRSGVAILPWPQISSIVSLGSMGSTLSVFSFLEGFLVQESVPVALSFKVAFFFLPIGWGFLISLAALLSTLIMSVASALFLVFSSSLA